MTKAILCHSGNTANDKRQETAITIALHKSALSIDTHDGTKYTETFQTIVDELSYSKALEKQTRVLNLIKCKIINVRRTSNFAWDISFRGKRVVLREWIVTSSMYLLLCTLARGFRENVTQVLHWKTRFSWIKNNIILCNARGTIAKVDISKDMYVLW